MRERHDHPGAHRGRRRFQGRRRQWPVFAQGFGARRFARRPRLRQIAFGGDLVRTNRGEGLRPRRQDRDRHGRQQTGDHGSRADRVPPRRRNAARKPARTNRRRRGDGDRKRRRNADLDLRRRRASPFRRSLCASRGRRPQSASALPGRSERRRGDAHRFRPARRTGVPPAGQRRAGQRASEDGAAAIDPSLVRFREDDGVLRAHARQAHDPGRRSSTIPTWD